MQMNLINCYYGWNSVFLVSAIHACSWYFTQQNLKRRYLYVTLTFKAIIISFRFSCHDLISLEIITFWKTFLYRNITFIHSTKFSWLFCIQKLYNWWRHVTQSSDQRQEKYTVKHSLNCYTITVTPRILPYSESFTYIGTWLGTKTWVSRYFDKTLKICVSKIVKNQSPKILPPPHFPSFLFSFFCFVWIAKYWHFP